MNTERMLTVLQMPHVTEKTSQASYGFRQYAFKVLPDATKTQIKQAVEKIFNVVVRSVRVCNVKSKPKRHGKHSGHTKVWKKAYIVLGKDQEIDIEKISGMLSDKK